MRVLKDSDIENLGHVTTHGIFVCENLVALVYIDEGNYKVPTKDVPMRHFNALQTRKFADWCEKYYPDFAALYPEEDEESEEDED